MSGLKPGNGSGVGRCGLGDRVADLRVADNLDAAREEADFTRPELFDADRLRGEDADFVDLEVLRRRHQPDLDAAGAACRR